MHFGTQLGILLLQRSAVSFKFLDGSVNGWLHDDSIRGRTAISSWGNHICFTKAPSAETRACALVADLRKAHLAAIVAAADSRSRLCAPTHQAIGTGHVQAVDSRARIRCAPSGGF